MHSGVAHSVLSSPPRYSRGFWFPMGPNVNTFQSLMYLYSVFSRVYVIAQNSISRKYILYSGDVFIRWHRAVQTRCRPQSVPHRTPPWTAFLAVEKGGVTKHVSSHAGSRHCQLFNCPRRNSIKCCPWPMGSKTNEAWELTVIHAAAFTVGRRASVQWNMHSASLSLSLTITSAGYVRWFSIDFKGILYCIGLSL